MRTALVFPGQGSQREGMGRAWAATPGWGLVDAASSAAGRDLGALLLHAGAEQLRPTSAAQVSTYLTSLLVLAALPAELDVVAVAGHSLGELTALVAAGVLDPAAGTALVLARGAAMQAAADAHPGSMAAVLGAPAEVVGAACAAVAGAWVANLNGPEHVVISGTAAGVAAAGEEARARGARRVLPLPVGGAFHTPLMAEALPPLRAALALPSYAEPALPVISNVDAAAHRGGWPDRLAAQLLAPVRWADTLATLAGLGVELLVECGPGGVLTGLARRGAAGLRALSVAEPADLDRLGELAGLAGLAGRAGLADCPAWWTAPR